MSDALLCSYVGLRTMVDGTVRITLDIEPAQAAKFWPPPQPGASFGLARISEKAAQKAAQAGDERKRWKDLPRSQQAALRCQEPEFWRFLEFTAGTTVVGLETAATEVRRLCGVQSRKDLDTDPAAGGAWLELENDFYGWQHDPRRGAA